jgi:hypothetical protein
MINCLLGLKYYVTENIVCFHYNHTNASLDMSSCEVSIVLFYFKGNRNVSTNFNKKSKVQNFTELFAMGVAWLNAERSKDITADGKDELVVAKCFPKTSKF